MNAAVWRTETCAARPATPRNATFSESDRDVLAACWHPVAFSDEVADRPVARTLLDEEIVLFRASGGVVAARDLCLHRGVPLSMGSVAGDEIVCAYHGFRYGADGRCTAVPALPGLPIPPKLRLTTYAATERYGMIWVRLDPAGTRPLPEWPEMEDAAFRRMHLPAMEWNASAARTLENFLDVGHFSWVHAGTFGDRDRPEVPKYEVRRELGGLRMEYPYLAANPDVSPVAGPAAVQRTMTYDVAPPFAVRLAIGYPEDRRYVICEACTPVAARKVRIYFSVALNFDNHRSEEDILAWEGRVVAEDRPVVEAQRPEELPLDLSEEFHLRCDRMSTAYRQSLRILGLGGDLTS